ncbi:hypothetical protein MCHI_002185 [Candidatus Magnetoovum chiemensis]|nr:hypothetical protein MCHI_002185 [Candidatus Magnetoovum chiemensis]
MDVLVPQYITAKGYTQPADDKNVYAQLLSSSVGTDPSTSIWASGTAYTTGQTVYYLDTAGTCNGCWCQYEALQNSTGKVPIDEPTYWVSLGAIEMYKMFDQYSNTKTTSASSNITISYCKAITDLAFLNVQAKQITLNAWNCKPSATYPL